MDLVKKKVEKEGCKKKEMITVEVKKEIIDKHERGMRVADIARFFNKSTSTICTVLKKKEVIRRLDAAKGVTRVSKQRPPVLEDVEKLLLVWINEKQLAGDTVTDNFICEKAKALYADLVSKLPGTSTENEEGFKASRGWFDNFKRRSGTHSVVRHGEAASSDAKAAEAFADEFQKLMVSECYLPQQVFNCDETGLFWKKMPKGTYITAEENAMPGHTPMKNHLTLLLCANASGDFKVKPLLVYHSENPQAFEKCKVQKSQLNLMWTSNSKAWVTRILFVEWINEVFGPAVKKYLLENNLPLKVLLVMDNAPAHPPCLEDDLLEEFEFIKVKFLPPNTTPLLQPMDQQVISNFKKLYTKALFQLCFEVTEGTNLTLREFWKNHFHIINCLKIIDKAWDGVTKRTLNSAWRKLWSDCVEGFAHEQEPPVVDEIVSLGKTMGLEVNEDDIQELVEEHGQELTTDELMDLHREQKQEVTEEISSDDEEKKTEESLTSNEIREMCKMWETVQHFVEKHHPNKAVAVRAMNLFNDNAMSHFREILKRREKRASLDRLLVKVARKEKDSSEPTDSSDSLRMSEVLLPEEGSLLIKREAAGHLGCEMSHGVDVRWEDDATAAAADDNEEEHKEEMVDPSLPAGVFIKQEYEEEEEAWRKMLPKVKVEREDDDDDDDGSDGDGDVGGDGMQAVSDIRIKVEEEDDDEDDDNKDDNDEAKHLHFRAGHRPSRGSQPSHVEKAERRDLGGSGGDCQAPAVSHGGSREKTGGSRPSRIDRGGAAAGSSDVAEIEVEVEDDNDGMAPLNCSAWVHAKERPHRCTECGKGYVRAASLKQHAQTHTGERPYRCTVCGRGFGISKVLKAHMRIHTGERPHACHVCGKAFRRLSALGRHAKTHTGERPHVCPVCDRAFSLPKFLKDHLMTHTGERPYACSFCGKGFIKQENLVCHVRSHTGERPHACAVCGKGFAYASVLKSHAVTHTGERPHACAVCGKGFAYRSVLKRHAETHAKEAAK
uniref:Tigger transposable element-derived protein 1-like isoform X1 n=2 Tax=Petromyzon marinus TaxID=7757 RepID=A0AAJ7UFZ8_PETMA|nr:tigger transposable element-derived protein 1-like isoform X1 [Petromyzon marinus]XP_032835766.1 tigger transposable element-derived protein 1-like isoform X1 [Petromyzon marinus]